MSQSTQTSNGAASPTGESGESYTLVSHVNAKESLSSTTSLTAVTAATKNTAMDDAASTSSPLSSTSSSAVDDEQVAVASENTVSSARLVAALEEGENQAANRLKKRIREEHDTQNDTQSKPKKSATKADVKTTHSAPAEVEVLDEAAGANGDGIVVDDGRSVEVELDGPKKPARKLKPKSKAAPKQTVATSKRGPPACAECKRRKVKCKHRQVDEKSAYKGHPATDSAPAGAADMEEKPAKPMENSETGAVAQVPGAHDDAHAEKPSKISKTKKKLNPKPTRAPPERTSTRTRKAPERFEDVQEQPAPRPSPQRKGTNRVFDPIYITTNSTSRLGRADIYHMLLEDGAWTSLSAEQQATLVSMFPDSAENQRLLDRIRAGETGKGTRPQWLKASDVFRDEVAKFKDDLTNGHLAKTWQAAAEQAVVERAAGEYDEWKVAEAESWWGQKSK